MKRSQKMHAIKCALVASACLPAMASAIEVDVTKSIFITDKPILSQFTLGGENGVWKKIATSAGDFSSTPEDVHRTLSDNPFITIDLTDFEAIALSNRFDLAPASGANCGEYRVTFGDHLDGSTFDMAFTIFEAKLQNPQPALGLEGCRPVAEFWANLSNETDINNRAQQLRDFYFNGLPGFDAVIDAKNYKGDDASPQSGQIRVNNRNLDRDIWTFFEFSVEMNGGRIDLTRATLKETPFFDLASDTSAERAVEAAQFQDAIIDALGINGKGLLANSMSELAMNIPPATEVDIRAIGSGVGRGGPLQSIFLGINPDNAGTISDTRLEEVFNQNTSMFASRIQQALNAAGSNLTPAQVLSRVQVLSCGGCHDNRNTLGGSLGIGVTSPTNLPFEFHSIDTEMVGTSTSTTTRIEAENFVNQSGTQVEQTGDSLGGNLNVGFMDPNDWLIYDLPTALPAGDYEMRFRVASADPEGGQFKVEQAGGGAQFATVTVPSTGGWQTYTTVSQIVALPEGLSQIAFASITDGWNINWFEIVSTSDGIERFIVKPQMKEVFIPERKANIETFLNSTVCTQPACLDSDGDSVTDDVDLCPDTPAGTSVDATGCPVTTGNSCTDVTVYPNWLHNDYDGGPNTHLNAGDLMQHNNQLFQANWYTSSLPGSDASWTLIGPCQ